VVLQLSICSAELALSIYYAGTLKVIDCLSYLVI
jgi:hypothetical protein